MPGDPKLCREYALQCSALAAKATNPDHEQLLTSLAQTWLTMAVELENTLTLLDAYQPEANGKK